MRIRLGSGEIYGQIQRRMSLRDFCLTETVYAPSSNLPRHSHDRAFVCFVLDGAYREVQRCKTYECERFSLVLHPAGDPHFDSFGPSGARCFNVEMSPTWLDRLGTHQAIGSLSGCRKDAAFIALLRKIHSEFHWNEPASAVMIEAFMLELEASLERTNRIRGGLPAWLKQIEEYIREHPLDRASLHDLAALVQVHPVHIARSFKRFYGCSLGTYWRRVVMQHACDQLARRGPKLVDIALGCGFSDQSSFSRSFKQMMNRTPSEYRSTMARRLNPGKHVQ